MTRYISRRLALAACAIAGVTIVVFVAARLSGDVVLLLAPTDASAAELSRLRVELGLDRPVWIQYARFVKGLARSEFGESIRYGQPAMDVILNRLPATLELAVAAFFPAAAIGLWLGTVSARRRGTRLDGVLQLVAAIAQSMPSFWIGIMAILVFAVRLGWLPTSGRGGLQHLILPAATLGLFTMAAVMRLTRSAMLEILGSGFVTFLKARGLSERTIVWKHALRNSVIPILTLAGMQLGSLLGGSVIVETVFSWPGIGSVMVDAVNSRDYPLVQAGVLVTSFLLIGLNLVVDLLVGIIDPRVRHAWPGGGK